MKILIETIIVLLGIGILIACIGLKVTVVILLVVAVILFAVFIGTPQQVLKKAQIKENSQEVDELAEKAKNMRKRY